MTARPPALQRSFFVLHKNRTKNRFLTTGPGSRAANVVPLCPALPGPGHREAGCKNRLCVRLLERFRFHDETKVNGWDFFSSVNLSFVELKSSLHLLFFIFILSKRVKKPLVLDELETNEVYQHRHRWFFHLRTSPKKNVLSASGKVTGVVFFFRQLSQFYLYRHNNVYNLSLPRAAGRFWRPPTFFTGILLNSACAFTFIGACQWLQVNPCPAGADGLDHLFQFEMQKGFGTGPAFLRISKSHMFVQPPCMIGGLTYTRQVHRNVRQSHKFNLVRGEDSNLLVPPIRHRDFFSDICSKILFLILLIC